MVSWYYTYCNLLNTDTF